MSDYGLTPDAIFSRTFATTGTWEVAVHARWRDALPKATENDVLGQPITVEFKDGAIFKVGSDGKFKQQCGPVAPDNAKMAAK